EIRLAITSPGEKPPRLASPPNRLPALTRAMHRKREAHGALPPVTLGRVVQLPAEGGYERPAVDLRGTVGADQNRVVLGSVEREGPDEPGVAQQLDALDDVESHAQPIAVVAQPGIGRKRRPRRPARELVEPGAVDDPLRPEAAHEASEIRGGGHEAA